MRQTSILTVFLIAALPLAAGCAPPEEGAATDESESSMTREGAPSADTSNALRSALQSLMDRYSENIVRAAELMPEEHYDYKPTENKRTFAGEVAHVASSSVSLCSALSGPDAPEVPDVSGLHEAGKDGLVAGLTRAFDYCDGAIATFDDSTRGDTAALFGDYRDTKAMAALILAADWGDHYGHLATYMRLNDLLPPTARESSGD